MTKKLSKKKLIFGAISLLVVVLVAAGVAIWLLQADPYKDLRGKSGVDASGMKITDQELYKAGILLQDGNLGAAKSVYDSRIRDAVSDSDKAQENVTAANAFVTLGQNDEANKSQALGYALAYAQNAERLHPTVGSAAILAVIYGSMGDTSKESDYYKKVDERSKALDAKQQSIGH